MNQETYLKILSTNGFPSPIYVIKEHGSFIDYQSQPFEVFALVLYGQIDIVIDGIKSAYLPGDTFHLSPNQLYAQNISSKGVKYLASNRGHALQEELELQSSESPFSEKI